jgi:hypothetical protein
MESPVDAEALLASVTRRPTRLFRLPRRKADGFVNRLEIGRVWDDIDEDLRVCLLAAQNGHRRWPIYLHGPVGTGKTRAALAFCDGLELARYWTVGQLVDEMCQRCPPWDSRRTWGFGRQWPNLTVIDELGQSERDIEYDAVKRATDWLEDKPAIYISNHPAKGDVTLADVYDKRIHSRVTCGTVFELAGPDRRFAEADKLCP